MRDVPPPEIEDRRKAISEGMEKPVSELLEKMFENQFLASNAASKEVQEALIQFALLLARSAESAERQTRWVIGLTISLTILTILLLFATIGLMFLAKETDGKIHHAEEIAERYYDSAHGENLKK